MLDYWSALVKIFSFQYLQNIFRTNLVASLDSAADIETENIVDCGVSCSSLQVVLSLVQLLHYCTLISRDVIIVMKYFHGLQSCSGLQYSSETKTCKKMKKVGHWSHWSRPRPNELVGS